MNKVLITLYDYNFNKFMPYVLKSYKVFCMINSTDFMCWDELLNPKLEPSWNKLLAVKEAFKRGYETILWSDADCLYIDNTNKFPWYSFGVNTDANGICLSHFVMKNTPYNNQLIDTLLFLGNVKDDSKFGIGVKWEQNCFKALLENFDIKFEKFPCGTILQMGEEATQNTHFIHYSWMSNEKRYDLIRKKFEEIYGPL